MNKATMLMLLFFMACAPKIRKAYINDLSGAELQRKEPTKPWPEKEDVITVPFGAAFELDMSSEKNFGNYRDPWYLVRYNNEKLWASGKNISFDGISKYFMIVTKAGLNLRQAPNTKSPILSVIPFEGKGVVVDRDPQIVEIQERRGFWLKVTYSDKTGWIFSGFVLTGDKMDHLRLEKASLKRDPIDLKEFSGKPDGLSSVQNGKGYVYMVPEPDCISPNGNKMPRILAASGSGFLSSDAETEAIAKVNVEIPAHLVTTASFCLCCCGNQSELIYLNPRGKTTVAYPIHFNKYDGYCSIEGASPSNETRISADRTKVFVLKKSPICEGTFSNDGGPGSGISTDKVDYNSGVFKIIHLNDDSVEQIDTLEVPKKYLKEWNGATVLKTLN